MENKCLSHFTKCPSQLLTEKKPNLSIGVTLECRTGKLHRTMNPFIMFNSDKKGQLDKTIRKSNGMVCRWKRKDGDVYFMKISLIKLRIQRNGID